MDARIVERALQTGEIEIAPLAFMRGRTLANAVVILDEAQNTTSMQMKMFLTRLGENSRMIVTGDPSQVDLPPGQTSGLAEATRLLRDVEGIGHVVYTAEDVIRHELVARIVDAYDKAASSSRAHARASNDLTGALHLPCQQGTEMKSAARSRRERATGLAPGAAHGRYHGQVPALEGTTRRRGSVAPGDRRGCGHGVRSRGRGRCRADRRFARSERSTAIGVRKDAATNVLSFPAGRTSPAVRASAAACSVIS